MARLLTTSDAKAARAVGVDPATVCRWPNKAELDAAVDALLADTAAQAVNMLLDAVPEAAAAKVGALKSRNETIRQAAATEIMDRILGKPTQPQRDDSGANHAMADLLTALRRTLPTDGT